MNANRRFALQLLATADALRHIREQVRFLIDADDGRAAGYPDAWIILADGNAMADALASIAKRMGDSSLSLG